MKKHWTRKVAKIISVVAIAIGLFSLVFMTLWNWLIPPLFRGPVITFWQALGLLVMSKIILFGLRGRPGRPPWFWRRRIMERWEQMSPEERERFRQGLQKGWNPSGPFGPPEGPKS
jgi:hypothetical protein